MSLEKFKNRLLDLNFLRKTLGFIFFNKRYSAGLRLKILEKPKRGRILVLAPHADDDVLGCGGTVIKHILQKDPIKVVYLTDNIRKKVRRTEAQKAAKIMGIEDIVFLGFKDGYLVDGEREVKKIRKIILSFKPNIIYLPHFLDTHPDHRSTAEILNQVISKINFQGEIWSYEAWTPVFANRIIKIDDVYPQKVLAIKAHQSQLQEREYLSAIQGLNSYRAGMFKIGKKAEAFFVATPKLYQVLITKNK